MSKSRTTAEQRRKWYHANKEKALAQSARYREKHPGKGTERMAAWRAANPEKSAAAVRRRIESGLAAYYRSLRRMAEKQAMPAWADKASIKMCYAITRRVSRETGILHHIDHIIPLNGKNVCGLHTFENLQLLTGRDNDSKGNRYE